MIYINGHDLTIEQVIAVSRQGETVAIAPDARDRKSTRLNSSHT